MFRIDAEVVCAFLDFITDPSVTRALEKSSLKRFGILQSRNLPGYSKPAYLERYVNTTMNLWIFYFVLESSFSFRNRLNRIGGGSSILIGSLATKFAMLFIDFFEV